MVAQRHAQRRRAELERVDDVARERRPPAHDLVAGIEHGLRDAVDDPVGTRADRDLLETHAVPVGQPAAQPVRTAVGVAVQLGSRTLHRGERLGKRAERSLVGRELHDPVEAELALHLLDRLARLVRDQPRERGPDEARRKVRHPTSRC